MNRWPLPLTGVLASVLVLAPAYGQTPAALPTFRSAVSLVSVSAVVKDRRGKPVRNLTRGDFQVFENGSHR